jgi:hypothetical protein
LNPYPAIERIVAQLLSKAQRDRDLQPRFKQGHGLDKNPIQHDPAIAFGRPIAEDLLRGGMMLIFAIGQRKDSSRINLGITGHGYFLALRRRLARRGALSSAR